MSESNDNPSPAPGAPANGDAVTDPDGARLGQESAPADSRAAALEARLAFVSAQLEDSISRARETQERLKEEHERLLRTAAEFDNFKKRAAKEKDDTRKYGVESLLKDFLPVTDNLERALDHAEQHDPKQVIEGVRLVQKMLDSALGKHGVTGFSALGQPFDPALHEALMQAESDEPPGTVVQEMARGFRLHDRLMRPAAVVVARAKEPAKAAPPAEQPEIADDSVTPRN